MATLNRPTRPEQREQVPRPTYRARRRVRSFARSLARSLATSFARSFATSVAPGIAAIGLVLGAAPTVARAQCPLAPLYSIATSDTSTTASAPASDTSFNTFQKSLTYFAQGKGLYAVDNSSNKTSWTNTSFTATIQNFPNPVPLADTHEYIFLAGADGHVYKVTASSGATATASGNTQRTSCSQDSITATPTVQLAAYSNAAFTTATGGDDLVMVITDYAGSGSCSTYTRNKIFAYYGSDLSKTPKWTFNGNGAYQMDYGSEGCALDYANNRIYCGTNQPSGRSQNTVWAISTIDGSLVWATNVGSVHARPMLANGKLYVGSYYGTLYVLNPDTGAQQWSLAVTSSTISHNVWPEFRHGGYSDLVLLLDGTNVIRGVNDLGTSGALAWSTSNSIAVTTMPVVHPTLGKFYAGASDGTIHQFDLSTGTSEAYSTVIPGGSATVNDPSLDLSSANAASIDRLVAVGVGTTGQARRYCIPWAKGSSYTMDAPVGAVEQAATGLNCNVDTDCAPSTNACTTAKCDSGSHVCYFAPVANGTACDDGIACSCASANVDANGNCTGTNIDECEQGVCTADYYQASCGTNANICSNLGDRGCAAGTSCCGAGSCKNLQTDSANCGFCGNVCPSGTTCQMGACERAPSPCTTLDATTLNNLASKGSLDSTVDIDFSNEAGSPPSCNGFISTFRTGALSSNEIDEVSTAGTVSLHLPLAMGPPIAGVAVTPDGTGRFGVLTSASGATPGLTGATGALASVLSRITFGGLMPVVAAATSGSTTVGFSNSSFNAGPVGPVLDRLTYTTTGQINLWVANWAANGDLWQFACATPANCSWTQTKLSFSSANRITALALAGTLYVASGPTISLVDPKTGALVQTTPSVIDLSSTTFFQPHLGEGTPVGILSLAQDPLHSDIYAEVRNANGASYVVQVRGDDFSARNLVDVQGDAYNGISALPMAGQTPASWTGPLAQGRLTLSTSKSLIRVVPGPGVATGTGSLAPTFQEWKVAP